MDLLLQDPGKFLIISFCQDYEAMVAQLEHQFRLGRLSIQGLWFYSQVVHFNVTFFC